VINIGFEGLEVWTYSVTMAIVVGALVLVVGITAVKKGYVS